MLHWPPTPLQPLELEKPRKFAHSLKLSLPRMTAPAIACRPRPDRNAVQRAAGPPLPPLPIEGSGDTLGIRVGLQNAVEADALVDEMDTPQVDFDQPPRGQSSRGHPRLQLGDRRARETAVEVAVMVGR